MRIRTIVGWVNSMGLPKSAKEAGTICIADRPCDLIDRKAVDGPEQMTCKAHRDDSVAKDPPSRVTYELSQAGSATKLYLVHDDFDRPTATYTGSTERLAPDAVFPQKHP